MVFFFPRVSVDELVGFGLFWDFATGGSGFADYGVMCLHRVLRVIFVILVVVV